MKKKKHSHGEHTAHVSHVISTDFTVVIICRSDILISSALKICIPTRTDFSYIMQILFTSEVKTYIPKYYVERLRLHFSDISVSENVQTKNEKCYV